MSTVLENPVRAGVMALCLSATPAHALQPLDTFLAAARQNNPDNHEAAATAQQREAQSDVARAAYLPTVTAQGQYTRNQYQARFALPDGPTFTIQPYNGLDAYFTLAVPLINVGAWMKHRAARANERVAGAQRVSTELSVESDVTQAYYQLLGSEAVYFAAQKSVEAARGNSELVRDRKQLGTANELDVQRAAADLARAEQELAAADQGVVNDRRGLETLARIAPEPSTADNYHEDDLQQEPPLERWLSGSSSALVSARPAVETTKAAERNVSAARASWLPTIAGQAQERATNVSGFTGRNYYYTITATATFKLDFSLHASVAEQKAAHDAARARENKARRAAEDAVYNAWHQVRVSIEKARAARAQFQAASLAQDLARDRYSNGVATQLEVVQTQRDFFTAAVDKAQADFDLQYARASLRLSSRRAGEKAVQP